MTKDPEESFANFLKSADLGNVKAQLRVAISYQSGINGAKKNIEEANKYYKLAADQGNIKAQCNLAFNMQKGDGIKKDRNAGIEKMIKSGAEDFYEQFATDIGLFYSDKKNEKQQAFEWFEKAYQINKTKTTINNYASCFMKGIGVVKDINKAKEILTTNEFL